MSQEQSRAPFKFGILVLVILLMVILSSKVFPQNAKSPLNISLNLPKFVSTFEFVFQSSRLQKIVAKNLEGKKGSFAVVIEDLTEDDKYSLNGSEPFPAASLYKLYLLARVLKDVEEGKLKLEDKITSSKSYLTSQLGSVDFGYEEAPETITYTIDEALTRVGRISDNFASIMLTNKVGVERLRETPYELEATNTDIKSPTSTTASDIAVFFKKVHDQKIYSPAVSENIVKYLLLNQLSNRIPAGVLAARSESEGVKIVHKTGELARVRHDAGIVYLEGRPYLIVMMSKDLRDENEGIETLANISRDIYQYFSSKNK